MCLALYLGTQRELTLVRTSHISVEQNEDVRRVKSYLDMPHAYFIGSHTGCSCGFPSVMTEEPIEYYEGLFESSEDRSSDIQSVKELLALLATVTQDGKECVLFPRWQGDKQFTGPPKGIVNLSLKNLAAETFVLAEEFLHFVSA